jgi:hypothetical protein
VPMKQGPSGDLVAAPTLLPHDLRRNIAGCTMTPNASPADPPAAGASGHRLALRASGIVLVVAATASVVVVAMQAGR